MSVDPNIDYGSHDPSDREELSDDPKIRAAQEQEARMRAALATKENPLRDDETTSERLKRADAERNAEAAQDSSAADGVDQEA